MIKGLFSGYKISYWLLPPVFTAFGFFVWSISGPISPKAVQEIAEPSFDHNEAEYNPQVPTPQPFGNDSVATIKSQSPIPAAIRQAKVNCQFDSPDGDGWSYDFGILSEEDCKTRVDAFWDEKKRIAGEMTKRLQELTDKVKKTPIYQIEPPPSIPSILTQPLASPAPSGERQKTCYVPQKWYTCQANPDKCMVRGENGGLTNDWGPAEICY